MVNKSKQFNDDLELRTIETYVRHLESTTSNTYTVEAPITSISQKQLADGQSIPDGLIIDNISGEKYWIEVTIFARSQKETERIFKMARNPEAYKDKIIIVDTDPQQDLHINFLKALQKKIIKDYVHFAQLSNSSSGTLIICFIDDSPFFYQAQCDELLSKIMDKRFYPVGLLARPTLKQLFLCVDLIMMKPR